MNRPRLIETLCHDGIIPPPRRPVILEQGLEQVASREEEAHPIFQRYTRRLSWWMLVLNLMQWACFFAEAVFFSDAKGENTKQRSTTRCLVTDGACF